jgi:hypothetical protein
MSSLATPLVPVKVGSREAGDRARPPGGAIPLMPRRTQTGARLEAADRAKGNLQHIGISSTRRDAIYRHLRRLLSFRSSTASRNCRPSPLLILR